MDYNDTSNNDILPLQQSTIPISQTRTHSLVESVLNVLIGFGIAIASQLIIFPIYNIHVPIETNLAIGGWMTIISIIRSYLLRRAFNNLTTKQ